MNRNPTAHDAEALLRKAGVSRAEIRRQLKLPPGEHELIAKAPPRKPFGRQTAYGAKNYYSAIFDRNFKSTGEGKYAEEVLKPLLDAGHIQDLQFEQPALLIEVTICLHGRMKKIRKTCRPDYRYIEDGQLWHHEYKGHPDDRFIFQLILWTVSGPTPYKLTWYDRTTDIIYPNGWREAKRDA